MAKTKIANEHPNFSYGSPTQPPSPPLGSKLCCIVQFSIVASFGWHSPQWCFPLPWKSPSSVWEYTQGCVEGTYTVSWPFVHPKISAIVLQACFLCRVWPVGGKCLGGGWRDSIHADWGSGGYRGNKTRTQRIPGRLGLCGLSYTQGTGLDVQGEGCHVVQPVKQVKKNTRVRNGGQQYWEWWGMI